MNRIEDLISRASDQDSIQVDGISIPVGALKKLKEEGYENLRVYQENKTVSMWGKTCTACFTEEQLRERV
ncbi:MAG: hypothetical protein JRF59_01865 [Deltaproteobacteria bacterium]|nr:hypothetical protein [Deltaproteobacteria bacterium]MBW1922553.1 hypothetical protein [Deltaproteobacteria bacterium]MBW2007081.1 hypothetical protein [Deltaproteobacteria bacterium]MBW2101348.1 hypothetical protein [Deltaproteobacteria bacterium]MBW2346574.1 hypothetical protein [Deltaproteobacteria bacterium]